MIAEAVVIIIIFWLVYWIDRERKLNGRPGIPVLGMLFDSVSINFTETVERSTKELRSTANNLTSANITSTKTAPPPPKRPSSPVKTVAAAPDPASTLTMPTPEPEETTDTGSTASANSTDKPKKKKKHKKSKHSKNKKSKSKESKKKSKHKKHRKSGNKKDEPKSEKESSDLTPDTTQGTSTDDPYLRKRKTQAVLKDKAPNSMKEGFAGRNPGLEQPKVLPVPESNFDKFVKPNVTKYVTEFTKSYYETLGIHDTKGIQDNIDCSFAQVRMIEKMLNHSYSYQQSTSEKLKALERVLPLFIDLHDTCVPAFKFNFQNLGKPILDVFEFAPFYAGFLVVHNVAINLPEIKHNFLQMNVDLNEGRYAEGGRLYAEQFLTIFSRMFARY